MIRVKQGGLREEAGNCKILRKAEVWMSADAERVHTSLVSFWDEVMIPQMFAFA
jgi:hypothetical protein